MAALQRRIRVAMDQPVEYDTITCNCIHFALALLGLGHLAGAMVGAATDQVPPPWDTLAPAPAKCHQTSSFFPGVSSTAVMEVTSVWDMCGAGASFPGDQDCTGGLSVLLCGNKQLHGNPVPALFDLLFPHFSQELLSSDVPP